MSASAFSHTALFRRVAASPTGLFAPTTLLRATSDGLSSLARALSPAGSPERLLSPVLRAVTAISRCSTPHTVTFRASPVPSPVTLTKPSAKHLRRLLEAAEERADTHATFTVEGASCTTQARPVSRKPDPARLEQVLMESKDPELRDALNSSRAVPPCSTCGLYHASAVALKRKAQALVLVDPSTRPDFSLRDCSESIECVNLVPLSATTTHAFGQCPGKVQPVAYNNKKPNRPLDNYRWATASTYCVKRRAMLDLLQSIRRVPALAKMQLCCATYWGRSRSHPDMQYGVSGTVDREDTRAGKCCFMQAAMREVREELGLCVTERDIVAMHQGIFVFRCGSEAVASAGC